MREEGNLGTVPVPVLVCDCAKRTKNMKSSKSEMSLHLSTGLLVVFSFESLLNDVVVCI